jgi:hypothetical protein
MCGLMSPVSFLGAVDRWQACEVVVGSSDWSPSRSLRAQDTALQNAIQQPTSKLRLGVGF